MISRRSFCSKALMLSTTITTLSSNSFANEFLNVFSDPNFCYLPIKPIESTTTQLPIPEGLRVPFDWNYFSLDNINGISLNCANIPTDYNGNAFLRLHIAIDVKGKEEIEVFLTSSGKKIGHFSIWYATGLQIFDTPLDCDLSTLKNEGITLKMIDVKKPIYLFSSAKDRGSHILLAKSNSPFADRPWLNLTCSNWSLQPFDWLEGTLLDGLQELYTRKNYKPALKTLNQHLDRYLIDDKNLIYVDLSSKPKDNIFNNLERGINFATIAKQRPNHPSINLFIEFCKSRFDENKNFKPDHLTTEGNYTIAYPLAVLAKIKNSPELFEMALIETEERIKLLTEPDCVYRAGSKTKGKLAINKNWSRGFVWFLLGLIRTIEALKDSPFKEDYRLKN